MGYPHTITVRILHIWWPVFSFYPLHNDSAWLCDFLFIIALALYVLAQWPTFVFEAWSFPLIIGLHFITFRSCSFGSAQKTSFHPQDILWNARPTSFERMCEPKLRERGAQDHARSFLCVLIYCFTNKQWRKLAVFCLQQAPSRPDYERLCNTEVFIYVRVAKVSTCSWRAFIRVTQKEVLTARVSIQDLSRMKDFASLGQHRLIQLHFSISAGNPGWGHTRLEKAWLLCYPAWDHLILFI